MNVLSREDRAELKLLRSLLAQAEVKIMAMESLVRKVRDYPPHMVMSQTLKDEARELMPYA